MSHAIPTNALICVSGRATGCLRNLLLTGLLGVATAGIAAASETSSAPASNPPASSPPAAADHTAAGSAAASRLSVAPLVLPSYQEDRPAWVDQPPILDGPLHLWPVASVPALTAAQSLEGLAVQKRIAVAAYVQHITGSSAPLPLGLDEDFIDAHLCDHQSAYAGTVITSDGKMYEHAVQLQFDDDFRRLVQRRYDDYRVSRRLSGLGAAGAGGVGLLLALTGLLKLAQRRTAKL